MGLFRKSAPPRPGCNAGVSRPWDPPESEFPAIVPTDTLLFAPAEQAAVAITGLTAYTAGFEIFMARRIRPGVPGLDGDPTPEMLRRLEFICQWPMYGIAETRVGIGRSDFPALYFQPSSAMAAALPGWAQKA